MAMPEDKEVWERVDSLYQADRAALDLGVRLREASPGTAVVELTVTDRHLGSLGQLHGGVLFTLADVAMSYAGNSRGGVSMAIRASIDYIDGAKIGDLLVATATEHSLRGKAGIYDVVIYTAELERLIATFRGNTLRVG
jgi:acyl-CoA thioesterase